MELMQPSILQIAFELACLVGGAAVLIKWGF